MIVKNFIIGSLCLGTYVFIWSIVLVNMSNTPLHMKALLVLEGVEIHACLVLKFTLILIINYILNPCIAQIHLNYTFFIFVFSIFLKKYMYTIKIINLKKISSILIIITLKLWKIIFVIVNTMFTCT